MNAEVSDSAKGPACKEELSATYWVSDHNGSSVAWHVGGSSTRPDSAGIPMRRDFQVSAPHFAILSRRVGSGRTRQLSPCRSPRFFGCGLRMATIQTPFLTHAFSVPRIQFRLHRGSGRTDECVANHKRTLSIARRVERNSFS